MNLTQKFKVIILSCLLAACGDQVSNQAVTEVATEDTQQNSGSEAIKLPISKPKSINQQADGSIRLTAENGTPIGPNIKYMPEWRAFGWFTGMDLVEWDVLVNKEEYFNVFLEWSVSDEEAGKEFILEAINDTLMGKVAKSGSWETYKIEKIGKIKLQEGQQKILFKSKTNFDTGALLDLRELKLIPVGEK
jgi:hypothetical protein